MLHRYGLVLALAEFGELLLVRVLAMHGRRARVRYFNKALRPMQHWAARIAFVISAGHMLQDAMVALVQLELPARDRPPRVSRASGRQRRTVAHRRLPC